MIRDRFPIDDPVKVNYSGSRMPARPIPLVTGEIYHVLNRGVFSLPIFTRVKDYKRFTETLFYYQNENSQSQFAKILELSRLDKENLKKELRKKKDFLVEIVAYCLMPNHFHLLVKQAKDRGIRNFITKSCNSYSHYFSTKYKRKGPLFEGRFKAIRVETEEQLIHLSRYIHLNPYSSYLVKNFKKLAAYPFSSLPEYLNNIKDPICQKEIVLSYFSGFEDYKKFVFRQAEYQRELGKIKHLALE